MQQESAETLGLNVLAWLVGNDELLPVFLGATGMAPGDLRTRAREADFLGSVLDFLLQDDAWVLAFAAAEGVRPDQLSSARRALPGGEPVHWTLARAAGNRALRRSAHPDSMALSGTGDRR